MELRERLAIGQPLEQLEITRHEWDGLTMTEREIHRAQAERRKKREAEREENQRG